uniref:Putative ovule protein n=1 Tax=Solanum chacoense TaxID=4108 RepID=A0A0V0I9F4_SOLCH
MLIQSMSFTCFFCWCVMLCSLNLLYIDAWPYFSALVTSAYSILPCFNIKLLFLCSFIYGKQGPHVYL